jgi:delta 1-pyrroline-5-carboxylate dehydrogenase
MASDGSIANPSDVPTGKHEAPVVVETKHHMTGSAPPAATDGESAEVPVEKNENDKAVPENIYVVPLQIGGKDVVTDSTFDVISPATGKLLHKCASASVDDAIKAIEAAQKAFPAWRDTLPAKKRDIFLRAADILDKRVKELGKYMEDETGAQEFWASGFNIPVSSDGLRDVAGRIATLNGTIPTIANPERDALIYKEPYGVILGIAPWYATQSLVILCPCELQNNNT